MVSSIFVDGVTQLPLDDPWIDPCGHSYNHSTWKSMDKGAEGNVVCPLSGNKFNIKALIKNFSLKDAYDKEIAGIGDDDDDDTIPEIKTDITDKQFKLLILKSMMKQDRQNKKLNEKIDKLTEVIMVTNKQVKNLYCMSGGQHLAALFPCGRRDRMKKIMNSGLTSKQMETLREFNSSKPKQDVVPVSPSTPDKPDETEK